MQNYKHMLQTAFVFYGRERRSVYWSATLTNLGFTLIALLIFGSIKTMTWLLYLYIIITIIPQIAITVRRLHDVSSSGKKMFLLLIPFVGWTLLFMDLISDSIPDINFYGDSLKYPKDNNIVLSENDINEKYKKHSKDENLTETSANDENNNNNTIEDTINNNVEN